MDELEHVEAMYSHCTPGPPLRITVGQLDVRRVTNRLAYLRGKRQRLIRRLDALETEWQAVDAADSPEGVSLIKRAYRTQDDLKEIDATIADLEDWLDTAASAISMQADVDPVN